MAFTCDVERNDRGEIGMLLVNFSHPVTNAQRLGIEQLVGTELRSIIDVPVQFDPRRAFGEQVRELCDGIALTSAEWQTEKLIVKLPSLDTIAACVLAELHGRMGYFPAIVRLRPAPGSVCREFEVAELIALQVLRDRARETRKGEGP
jgi:hypothetical protein